MTENVFSISIGKILYLDSVIIKKAEPTFSNDIDENGYPIWAKISLDISTTDIAYVEMLERQSNTSIQDSYLYDPFLDPLLERF